MNSTLKSPSVITDTSIVKGWKRALIHHGQYISKEWWSFFGVLLPWLFTFTALKIKGFTENGVTIEDSTPRPSLTKLVFGILGKIN